MTLEELEKLPNGLHDADVEGITVDYAQRKVIFDLAVWVGRTEDTPERREAFKKERMEISGLLFLVMEPRTQNTHSRHGLTIDGCDMSKNNSGKLLESLPADSFLRSLWVNEWNVFIHIAANSAALVWVNDSAIPYQTS
jgi:hypothetical protein